MHLLTLFTIVAFILLYALAWHDKSARDSFATKRNNATDSTSKIRRSAATTPPRKNVKIERCQFAQLSRPILAPTPTTKR